MGGAWCSVAANGDPATRTYVSEKHACSSAAVHSREKHVRRCGFCVSRQ